MRINLSQPSQLIDLARRPHRLYTAQLNIACPHTYAAMRAATRHVYIRRLQHATHAYMRLSLLLAQLYTPETQGRRSPSMR